MSEPVVNFQVVLQLLNGAIATQPVWSSEREFAAEDANVRIGAGAD